MRVAGGRVAVVIGDVMGRGVDAAVAGSRMRAAVRVLIAQDPRPGALAQGMDRLMVAEALTPLATAAYLLFDPAADEVELVVAGHLPPCCSTRTARRATSPRPAPVLGVGTVPRPSARVTFAVGDTMLLYTDGLAERRGEGIDDGLARLKTSAAELTDDRAGDAGGSGRDALTARLTALVDHVADPERHDDIAAVVLQRTA